MTATETVTTDGLPKAGTWTLDPAHSSATFSVRHLGLSKVRGRFDQLQGTLEIAEDPDASRIDVTIDASSISTNHPVRDAQLRSADYLDVERYPSLRFRSTGIAREGDGWLMSGELTVRDVTRPVAVEVRYLGTGEDPFGLGTRAAFEGSTEIQRGAFGVGSQGPQQDGGILVGQKVAIELDVQFLRA